MLAGRRMLHNCTPVAASSANVTPLLFVATTSTLSGARKCAIVGRPTSPTAARQPPIVLTATERGRSARAGLLPVCGATVFSSAGAAAISIPAADEKSPSPEEANAAIRQKY